jgi:transcriptional repressor NrdR
MICPHCFHSSTDVRNSRPHKKTPHVWRRRRCPQCGYDFTTDETPRYNDFLKVIHASTPTQAYNHGKLIISIAEAFTHDKTRGTDSAGALADTVLQELLKLHQSDLRAKEIATRTHEILARFDRIAGIQYAINHGIQI